MSVSGNQGGAAGAGIPDSELIAACRDGDDRAFAMLWTRHSDIARRFARSLTQAIDADDLVSESFARILTALRGGNGPTEAFRPYLFATVRNVAISWARKSKEEPSAVAAEVVDPRAADAALFAAADAAMLLRAFKTLPERWREVLWLTEVDALAPHEISSMLKLSANSAAALAYRAREGLRQAWVQAHVETAGVLPPHLWVLQHVGQHAREGLSPRNAARFDAHVAECESCRVVVARAIDASRRFTPLLLPLSVGIVSAAGMAGLVGRIGSLTARAAAIAPILSSVSAVPHRRSPLLVTLSAAAAVAFAAGAGDVVSSPIPLPGDIPAWVSPLPTPAETPTTTPSPTPSEDDGSLTPPPNERAPVRDQGDEEQSPPASALVPLPRVDVVGLASSAARLVLNDVDTGGGVLLPVVSGAARPGATVTVNLGVRTETVIASSDGSWRTPEITVAPGTHEVSVSADGVIVRRSVSIAAPVVSVARRSDAFRVIVHGMRSTRYNVSLSGNEHTETTDGDGTTTAEFSGGGVHGTTVTVFARSGDRSGPATTIIVP